ncbi:MAG TPA: transglycosylase domain-containing protein [Solirubrobacteraceae bacterium]|nr:transglycosylase domain-containing protein [Solirubrobacteraceae bacterium]
MSVETGSNITPLFGDQEPPDGPPPVRSRVKKLRLLAIFLPLTLLAIVSTVFGMMMAVASDLPDLENRKEYQDAKNSVLVDSQNREIGVLTNNQSRVLVSYEDIPRNMRDAIIAIEDRRFYENSGVDVRGIARAFTQDILQRKAVQGGSTIAQQFVKNALQAQADRTVFQKLREAALAYHLTRKWPKSKILTQYLNSIYFGNGAYGVESAARTYFGNQPDHQGCGSPRNLCVRQLKPEEAALLAGVVANPSAYDPVAHPEAAERRRNLVLKDMLDQGLLPRLEYYKAIREALPAAVDIKPPTASSKAPYFTTWVRQQLVDKFGARRAFEGGLKIKTTLDLDLQDAAEDAVKKYLPDSTWPSAALVAIDNQTGEVRAMVGGRDYAKRPFNLATQGQRQPGSSIKPFILAEALKKYSAGSVWPSRKRVFTVPGTKGKELFPVKNFENKYAGSQTLAGGLTYSDNSVYAAVGISVGPKKIANLAERMGIRTPVSSNYAMTLGGLKEGVTPLDMAHAYETLIAGGRRVYGTLGAGNEGPVGIKEVLGPNDKVIKANKTRARRVLPARIANETVNIMTTVVSQGTGRRAALGPGEFAAGKTGTTENSGDAWFVGFNQRWTVAVWVGYADKLKPMLTEFAGQPVEGGTYPALIWHDFMVAANAKADERNAKERERRGLPPKTEDEQQQQTTTPVIPTKPAPVPEGGDSAPVQEQPAAPADGTGTGEGATGTGDGSNGTGQTNTAPAQPSTGSGGGTGGAGAGGTSAPGEG